MNFSKEQKDYIIHALEHCEVLTGGRSSGKTLELIKQQEKEIERLNNIIKNLEEWLYDNTDYEEYDRVEKDTFNYVIKKIEELKGSDKE